MSSLFLSFGEGSQRRHWLADDTVRLAPVSRVKFPANREISREFSKKMSPPGDSALKNTGSINNLRANSLLSGAGNFLYGAGNFPSEIREPVLMSRQS